MTGTFDRAANLARLAGEDFDVVVVGGGVTGAGTALDAASRGLRVALVERHDLASGTSSRSSKMVHGGLRYLQHGEVRLVYEALAERQVAMRNAPHLVTVLPFLFPIFHRGGVVNKKVARAFGTALWQYDLTGGLRIGRAHRRLSAAEVLDRFPAFDPARVASGYLYYDARADDARLTLALARTAALHHGAVVVTRAAVTGIDSDGGVVRGVRVDVDDRETEVRTRSVVNAAGVWADRVAGLDDAASAPRLRPAKGVHVAVPRGRLPASVTVLVPGRGGRSVFVVPWGDVVYLGTTDTDHDGDIDDPRCTPDDVAELLAVVNAGTTAELTPADVVGTWAGLRPLVDACGSTADLSRRHAVTASPSGVVTVTGGKLTTYRRMAADAVDAVCEHLGVPVRCRTARLPLVGAEGWRDVDADDHLRHRYGAEAPGVLRLIEERPDLGEPLVAGQPYRRAEAVYAVRHEMATTLDDVLSRRTRARLFALDATDAAAGSAAELLASELGWDPDRTAAEVAAFRRSLADERRTAGIG